MSGDEEMDSDWYILTLSQDDSIRENVTTQNSTRLFFNLNYNINYLVNITVIDCFGRKNSTLLPISESKCMHDNVLINYIFLFSSGGCDVPLSLVNASINEYESTHEGTDIMFTCNHNVLTHRGHPIHRHLSVYQFLMVIFYHPNTSAFSLYIIHSL